MKEIDNHRLTRQRLKTRSRSVGSACSPRALACALALTGSLSQPLWALGLGAIESSSILGQPLAAQIEIVGEDEAFSADELMVTRVGAAEAQRIGIDLMSDGLGIRVTPVHTADGWVINVISQRAIAEPFLNFVVKLEWPKGSVYREYTLLLDPPGLSLPMRQSDRSQSQMPQAAASARQNEAVDGRSRSVSASVRGRNPLTDRYRVRIGDSLLSLAEQWLAEHGASNESHQAERHSIDSALAESQAKSLPATLDDTAQWLFEHNPQAFSRNSVNSLMAGALLKFPAASDSSERRPVATQSLQAPTEWSATSTASSLRAPKVGFTYPLGGEEALMLAPASQPLPKFVLDTQADLEIAAMPSAANANEIASTALPAQPQTTPAADNRPQFQSRLRLGTPIDRQQWRDAAFGEASNSLSALEKAATSAEERAIEASLISMVESQLDVSNEIIEQLQRDNRDLRDQLQRLEQSDYLETLTELVRLQGQQLVQMQAQQAQRLASSGTTGEALPAASGDSIASLQAEVHAVGLLSTAAAAGGAMPSSVAATTVNSMGASGDGWLASVDRLVAGNRDSGSEAGVRRASPQARASFMAFDNPSALMSPSTRTDANPSRWQWAASLLLPLMMMGVYLLVSIRRQPTEEQPRQGEGLSADEQAYSQDGFSLEGWAHSHRPDFNTVDSRAYFSQEQHRPATAVDLGLQWSCDDTLGEYTGRDTNDSQARVHPSEDRNGSGETASQLDGELDRVFNLAMSEIFPADRLARQNPPRTEAADGAVAAGGEARPQAQSAGSGDKAIQSDRAKAELGATDVSTTSNIVLFPGVRRSDEELKRSIKDKVCDYQPPKPEESAYIVQEGIEDIDRYLDIQMIDTPQIQLDESHENPLNDHRND